MVSYKLSITYFSFWFSQILNLFDFNIHVLFFYNFRLLDRTLHSTSWCSFSSSSASFCSLASWPLALIHLEELVLSKQLQPFRYRICYIPKKFLWEEYNNNDIIRDNFHNFFLRWIKCYCPCILYFKRLWINTNNNTVPIHIVLLHTQWLIILPYITSHGWGRSNDLGLWFSNWAILIYHPVLDN